MFFSTLYNVLFVGYQNGNIHCFSVSDSINHATQFHFDYEITCLTCDDDMYDIVILLTSSLIVGLRGGHIGLIKLSENQQQENQIADSDIIV